MGEGGGVFSKFSHSSGHINFERGDVDGGTYRGGSVTASSVESLRLGSRKWINRGDRGFDRGRVIYREGLARETFQKTWAGGGEEGRRLRSSRLTYPQHFTSVRRRKEEGGWLKADTRRGKGSLQGVEFYFPPGIIF